MTVRKLYAAVLGTCLGAGLGQAAQGQEAVQTTPATTVAQPSANQRAADAIARQLNQSPRLSGFRVSVTFQDGAVELAGSVRDAAQREEVLRIARETRGVSFVRDRLSVEPGGVVQAQNLPGELAQGVPLAKPIPGAPPELVPPPPPGVGGIQEPTPIFQAPPGFPSGVQPPPMPPYAWPTVAPYNNYSRVAYPTAYPYESWPYIGPMYPFPRVPLGWRSVKLTWEDGHWWFGQNATGHDWWRIRYW